MSLTSSAPQSQIVQLLRKLRDESATLVGQQVALAKAEISEKVNKMISNAVQLAIGGFVAYAGGIIILFAVADLVSDLLMRAGLSEHTSIWLSRALIGAIVAITGWLLIMKAKKSISDDNLVPDKTLESLGRDKEWAQQKVQSTTP